MSREVVTVGPDDTVRDVLNLMKRHDIHEVPLKKGRRVLGLVTMKGIMKRKGVPPGTKASTLVVPCPEVGPETTLPDAAETMIRTGFRALPVIAGKKLLGLVSRTDLVRAILDMGELRRIKVADVMTPTPQCVAATATIQEATKVMGNLGERSVPVVDRSRRLVGVIGLKDLADLFARPKSTKKYGDWSVERGRIEIEVRSVMRSPAITVGPDATVERAVGLMMDHGISTVIVEEDGDPTGIVTKQDLMQLLASLRERDGLFVEISGLEEQPEVFDAMYEVIRKGMRRIEEIVTPRTLTIHVQTYKAVGDRQKWSLHARFSTAHRMYFVKHFDWDLMVALEGLLDLLEKRIKKEKEKRITARRRASPA